MTDPNEFLTDRGIDPDGDIAKDQHVARYEGANWKDRRKALAAIDPRFGRKKAPHNAALAMTREQEIRDRKRVQRAYAEELKKMTPKERATEEALWLDEYHQEAARPPTAEERAKRRRGREAAWTSFLKWSLSDSDGWALPRHGVYDDLPSQIRPDVPPIQRKATYWHDHGRGKRSLRARPRGREEVAPRSQHEATLCTPDKTGEIRERLRETRPEIAAEIERYDMGDLLPTGHLHPETGETIVPIDERHCHVGIAKYVYLPGNGARGLAAHPSTLAAMKDGGLDDLVFLSLEGTPKMLALTSAGYQAVDAGSVTLWDSARRPPLPGTRPADFWSQWYGFLDVERLAIDHLAGRDVAVVVDSDWATNPAVRANAWRVADLIAPYARVIPCAPPASAGEDYGWHHKITGDRMYEKLGVDDWIGKGHDALDMVGVERLNPAPLNVEDPRFKGVRADRRKNIVSVLAAVGTTADPETCVGSVPVGRLARDLGVGESTVQRAMREAERRDMAETLAPAERSRDPETGDYRMFPALVRVTPDAMPETRQTRLRDWLRK